MFNKIQTRNCGHSEPGWYFYSYPPLILDRAKARDAVLLGDAGRTATHIANLCLYAVACARFRAHGALAL